MEKEGYPVAEEDMVKVREYLPVAKVGPVVVEVDLAVVKVALVVKRGLVVEGEEEGVKIFFGRMAMTCQGLPCYGGSPFCLRVRKENKFTFSHLISRPSLSDLRSPNPQHS